MLDRDVRLDQPAAVHAAAAQHRAGGRLPIVPLPGGIALCTQLFHRRKIVRRQRVFFARIFTQNVFQQDTAELRQRDPFGQMLGNIRHAAAHRADALGLDLRRIDTQRLTDNGKVRIEHDRAMMHHAALTEVLRVAGELLPVDRDVVAAVHLRLDAERRQRAHNRLAEELHIQRAAPAGIGDKGEIQVAHVVVDRAAA